MTFAQLGLGRRLLHVAAFGFGAGTIAVAPGTFGTLVAIPIYLLLRDTDMLVYGVVVIAMFIFGIWCCGVTERDFGRQDMPGIVWDEIVGYLVAMFAAPIGWEYVVAGFVLFRLFDIWKPFPIRALEQRTHGGFGIMIDDILAGVYALAVMRIIARFW